MYEMNERSKEDRGKLYLVFEDNETVYDRVEREMLCSLMLIRCEQEDSEYCDMYVCKYKRKNTD